MGDDEFSKLVGSIYDAALDPDIWPVMINRAPPASFPAAAGGLVVA